MSSKFLQALAGKRVYPITDRQLSQLSHAQQVGKLVEADAPLIQLREKIDSPAEFYNHAAAALQVARAHGVALIINDRADLALALQADGVHLGQDDLPPEAARRLLGDNAVIGYSTHSLSQALEVPKLPVDYIAIGPIFQTSTKENPSPVVGLDGLRVVREAIGKLPLVAIGGITPANIEEVIEAGADAVAMIRGLWPHA